MPRGTPKAHKRQHKKAQRWIQLVRTQANTIKSAMAQTINQSRAPLEQRRSVNRGREEDHSQSSTRNLRTKNPEVYSR